MKRILLGLLIAGLAALNHGASTPSVSASVAAEACPAVRIRITSVTVTPPQAAQEHTVTVVWAAGAPQCYTINKFAVKGTLTFANGQKRGFAQSVAGNQSTVQIRVPGLLTSPLAAPSLAPRSVSVEVSADASSPVTGSAGNFSAPPPGQGDTTSPLNSCLPLVGVSSVQAVFAGLLVSPENPNGTHFPKVNVSWQVNALPSCYKIDNFTVTVSLPRASGGPRRKTVTEPGGQNATEVVLDNSPVSADFTPGVILASVRASGTARITGNDRKEFQLN